jgi:HK97 gp10 family phage protein
MAMQNRERLLKKMAALPQAVRLAIKQSLAQGADELVAMQRRLVPKKTGKLRDSITQTWGGKGPAYASLKGETNEGDPDLSVTITAGNSAVRYAHLVEFPTSPHINKGKFPGTKHPGTDAQPFFYPSYRALKRRIKNRITRATKKAARQVASGQ